MTKKRAKSHRPKQTSRLVMELLVVLTRLKPAELIVLYEDLFTKREFVRLAKRLAVARGLLDQDSYQKIQYRLSVTPNTVAQIAKILNAGGKGFNYAQGLLRANTKSRSNSQPAATIVNNSGKGGGQKPTRLDQIFHSLVR